MKKILITGGAGFIGANLARESLKRGYDTHLFVRQNSNNWRLKNILLDVKIHAIDLLEKEKVCSTLKSIRPEWIFHTAVHGAYSRQTDLDSMIATNITGTANLLMAAISAGFESFINTGSSSEYGYKDHAPTEQELLDPNSFYAITKATSTYLCRHLSISYNLHIPTLRLYSVYGQYEDPQRLMPTLLQAAKQGTLPPLVDPNITRDFVYINDVINAYLTIASTTNLSRGSIYNIASGTETTLEQLITIVKKLYSITCEPKWGTMEKRAWDTTTWIGNPSAIYRDTKWKAIYGLEEGIKEMMAWMEENSHYYT